MLEKLSTNCHWQKRTPVEALSCNLNSKDNFKFHIKRDIKYRTIYRISQELINETIESMNRIAVPQCSRTLEPGKFLFGEDLPKTLQELKTTNKLMTSITSDNRKGLSKSKNYSNNQFRGNNFHGNQSKPFLVNRGGEFISPQFKPTAKSFPTQEEIHQELNNIKSKVSEFPPFVVSRLIPYFRAKVNSFKGGQLSSFCHKWERLTSDASILQIISGDYIEFLCDPPSQESHPPNSVPRNHVS